MSNRSAILLILCICAFGPSARSSETNGSSTIISRRSDVHFARSAPYATPTEINRRLGISAGGGRYALAAEKFQIIVPGTFATNVTYGLFVWISPGDAPAIPSSWEAELAKEQLLFVGAYKSGNQRLIWERVRLALEAVFNMSQIYKIDTNRIYLAGFSGGGRVAGMVGMGYPEIFAGTICICGVGFYKDIPTTTGEHWARTFDPEGSRLAQAKNDGRFVLLTGDKDVNRENTHDVWRSGFEREGFCHVRYLEVPGLKHALPSAEVLGTVLRFVGGKETR